MILSIIFLLLFVLALISTSLVAYSAMRIPTLFQAIGPSFIFIVCLQGLLSFIFSAFGMHSNLFIIATINFLIFVTGLMFLRRSNRKNIIFSAFYIDTVDLIAFAFFMFCGVIAGIGLFGFELDIHYVSSDASVHLLNTERYIFDGVLDGQFMFWFYLGTWIEFLSPLIPSILNYQIQALVHIFDLLMASLVFYSIIKNTDTVFNKVVSVVMPSVYMLAYPLNDMLFGFGYMGFSIIIIGAIVFFLQPLGSQELSDKTPLVFFSTICMLGLTACYILFVPTILISVLLFVLFIRGRRPREKYGSLIPLFVIPMIALILQLYILFGPDSLSGVSLASQLVAYGGIYRDLFSSFIPAIPLVLFWIFSENKSGMRDASFVMTIIFVGTVLASFVLGVCFGVLASYYYYKFYYPLWMFLCIGASKGLYLLGDKEIKAALSYCISWAIVFGVAFSGIDRWTNENANEFNKEAKAWNNFGIYQYNFDFIANTSKYSESKIALYLEAMNYIEQNGGKLPALGYYLDMYWYDAITYTDGEDAGMGIGYWDLTDEEFMKRIREKGMVVLINPNEEQTTLSGTNVSQLIDDILQDSVVIYSNDGGCIVKVNG